MLLPVAKLLSSKSRGDLPQRRTCQSAGSDAGAGGRVAIVWTGGRSDGSAASHARDTGLACHQGLGGPPRAGLGRRQTIAIDETKRSRPVVSKG